MAHPLWICEAYKAAGRWPRLRLSTKLPLRPRQCCSAGFLQYAWCTLTVLAQDHCNSDSECSSTTAEYPSSVMMISYTCDLEDQVAFVAEHLVGLLDNFCMAPTFIQPMAQLDELCKNANMDVVRCVVLWLLVVVVPFSVQVSSNGSLAMHLSVSNQPDGCQSHHHGCNSVYQCCSYEDAKTA